MLAGITSAPSTSPSRTFWMASRRLFTRTGSIALNSPCDCFERSMRSPPSSITFADAGTPL